MHLLCELSNGSEYHIKYRSIVRTYDRALLAYRFIAFLAKIFKEVAVKRTVFILVVHYLNIILRQTIYQKAKEFPLLKIGVQL